MATLSKFNTITNVLEGSEKTISFAQLKLQAVGSGLTATQAFDITNITGTLSYLAVAGNGAVTNLTSESDISTGLWITKTGIYNDEGTLLSVTNAGFTWTPALNANNTDKDGAEADGSTPGTAIGADGNTGTIAAFTAEAAKFVGATTTNLFGSSVVNVDVLADNDAPVLASASAISTFDNAHANAAYPLTLKDLLTKAGSNLTDVDNVIDATLTGLDTAANQVTFKVNALHDHQVSTIELGGTIENGNTVTLSGITNNGSTVAYTISATATAVNDAPLLAAAINAVGIASTVTVVATVDSNNKVVLTSKAAGGAFVAAAAIGGETPTTTATITDVTPIMGVLKYGVEATVGELATINTAIAAGTPIPAGFTQYSDTKWYKAGAEVVEADTEITAADVLVWTPQTGLAADSTTPDASFTVTAWDGQLESTQAADVTFTIVNDAPVITVTNSKIQDNHVSSITLGSKDDGDTIDVLINGVSALSDVYTMAGAGTEGFDAAALSDAINAGGASDIVTATANGDVVTLTGKTAGTWFTATTSVGTDGNGTLTAADVRDETLSNVISVTDNNGDNVKVGLSVINGLMTLSTKTGLTFTNSTGGDGTNDSFMEFTGTQKAVNDALATLSYAAASDGNSDDILTVEVVDTPNSGALPAIPKVIQIQVGGDDNAPVEIDFTAPVVVAGGANSEPTIIAATTSARDVSVSVSGSDLVLQKLADSTNTLKVTAPANKDLDGSIIKFADFSTLQFNGGAKATLYGTAQIDHLIAGANGDNLFGYAGDDLLDGGADRDALYGGAGSDAINGGNGNDYISGGAGSDTINGGAGNDILVGGTENDEFIFGLTDGADIIVDFGGTTDKINLPANTPVAITASGTDTLITLSAGNSIRLAGVAKSNVDGNDFIGTPVIYDNSVFGTGSAETIVGTAGKDLIVGGADADTINLVSDASADRVIQTATGDSGTFTQGDAATNTVTTATFDVVNNVKTGDVIALAAYTGTAAGSAANQVLVNAIATTAVTVATDSGATLADNTVTVISGTYNGTNFVGGAYTAAVDANTPATNVDTLLVYDANATTATQAYEAIVLVGYHGAISVAAGAGGLLTLA